MQCRSRLYTPAPVKTKVATVDVRPEEGHSSWLKPMLSRLETTLGRHNLAQSIVFLSRPGSLRPPGTRVESAINFVVGFNGSAHSQAALDLALCMAHQTRLAKANPVLVHVVYVVDATRPKAIANADKILWQARCLASEWRGALHAHLRVGAVAEELSRVAQEVEAAALLLGCYTANHRLVNQLAGHSPCAVVGLPR